MRSHILRGILMSLLLCAGAAWGAEPIASAKGTLWPGESTSFEGVKIRWDISEPTKKNPTPEQTLSFTAGKTVLRGVEIARSRIWNENSLQASRNNYFTMAYIGGVYFRGDGHIRVLTSGKIGYDRASEKVIIYSGPVSLFSPPRDFPLFRIDFTVQHCSNEYDLFAAPQKLDVFVSHVCPIRINEWKFGISSSDMKLADGSEYMELTAENTKTGEKSHMPVTFGSKRMFGRYTFDVNAYFPPSRTAEFAVAADVDKSVRGRDAYVEDYLIEEGTLETVLEKMRRDFGFSVEWTESPKGSAESVNFVKEQHVSRIMLGRGDLQGQLRAFGQSRPYAFRWFGPTHLQVCAANYEEKLKKEAEQKELGAKNDEIRASFEREYQTVVKVYPVERLTPTTAKALLEPEMHTYYLVSGSPDHVMVASATSGLTLAVNTGILAHVAESIIADDKANALVVTAIPSTHARIAGLLSQMEGMFEQKTSPAELKRYRLSVALLEGVPAVGSDAQGSPARTVAAQDARFRPPAGMRLVGGASQGQEISKIPASTTTVVHNPAGLDARVSDFVADGDDVRAALARLARDSGLTLLVSPRVQGRITVNLKNASVRQVLEVVLPPLNATYRETGGAIQILSNEELLLDAPPPSAEESAALMKRYGLSMEELSTFGLAGVRELGSGAIDLAGETGRPGRARLALTEAYQGEVQFLEVRDPYLIVKGYLSEMSGGKVLVENTLYLKQGKPSVLGLTNLRQALILVVRLDSAL